MSTDMDIRMVARSKFQEASVGVDASCRLDASGVGHRQDLIAAVASLSRQQRRVFDGIGEGLSNRAIAERLGLCEATVRAHASAAFSKLGCSNRTQAALLALCYKKSVLARPEGSA